MKEIVAGEFQYTINELLIRNRSILDLLTKFQDSNARVNRAIIKAVTQCGCININAQKQSFPDEADFQEIREAIQSHLDGELCDNCRDIIEKDIGTNLFYLVSICNTLDLDFYDVIVKEHQRIKLLGKFNLR